jgi:hypothetical protein|tara:strand:+ start:1096 stop:1419 length:324 start_codon:yes stop_codon:yes gene_type:complete
MKIEIEITMDMILNHFPKHDKQDIEKALKTPKIKLLYGLMQWQELAKNRQNQLDELKEKMQVEKTFNTQTERKFEHVWTNYMSDEDRANARKDFEDNLKYFYPKLNK